MQSGVELRRAHASVCRMKLATIRTDQRTCAVRAEDGELVELPFSDVGSLLRHAEWEEVARSTSGRRYAADGVSFAPVVTRPEKIICVGLNYRSHILEMGRELPEFPTLFAKFSRALLGANDTIELPAASSMLDWEAELGVVIGKEVRRADNKSALAAIAGLTIVNDVTARDYQYRTSQWLQGKTFERSTPVGPWLTVRDWVDNVPDLELRCEVDGEVVQSASTADLVFDPVELVAYISQFVTLAPGDLIATGTPGGVGHARKPARYLESGNVLVTAIGGLGMCQNRVVDCNETSR